MNKISDIYKHGRLSINILFSPVFIVTTLDDDMA